MKRFLFRVVVAALWGTLAVARDAAAAPPALELWLGVFDPGLPPHAPWPAAALTPVARGGSVRVLAPLEGTPAAGEVVVVHALLGKIAPGRVEQGRVALATFAYDQRDGDDGVLVFPSGTPAAIAAPGAGEVAAVKAALLRTDALAGVRRALAGLELAGVDVDRDGRADVIVTYGCAAWFDGQCQARGQFVLARRGVQWRFVD